MMILSSFLKLQTSTLVYSGPPCYVACHRQTAMVCLLPFIIVIELLWPCFYDSNIILQASHIKVIAVSMTKYWALAPQNKGPWCSSV